MNCEEMFTQSPTEETKLIGIPSEAKVDNYNKIIRCVEEGKPFIAGYYCCARDIYCHGPSMVLLPIAGDYRSSIAHHTRERN